MPPALAPIISSYTVLVCSESEELTLKDGLLVLVVAEANTVPKGRVVVAIW